MLKCLVVFALVTGCTDDASEGIGASSNWVLTFGPGGPQRATTQPCATLAPIKIWLTTDTSSLTACSSGGQCSLQLVFNDANRAVTADFTDDSGSGSLTCIGNDLGHNPNLSCWFAAPNTPYCKYPGELVAVAQASSGTVHDPEPAGIR